ncbi:type IV pilus twitching motility protein PilT [candidate division CSSED10-310 bacterium]|uniref:Type IV pilus twitching motility protein PilT n=1 Tax=candidate division CSSED10-310 bacterium TaxID=2855610 RepID=A0ABV6YW84_UNCC1
MVSLPQLLKIMIERGSTDLHITTGSPPQIRIDGHLEPLDYPPLTAKDTKQLGYSVLTDAQKHRFEEDKELDFSFGVKGLSRFRANIYNQRGAVALAIRTIPFKILSFDDLGLPKVVGDFSKKPKGLILVTGPTGSGKSTTLAAIINKINEERPDHIVTIEDPIEYLHQHKRCVVNQREIGQDTKEFSIALRSVLRQDPDVILIGEMRDLETMEMALRCAETGHLTFATLHTNSCDQTINRIVDAFPQGQQQQIRVVLSFVLEGVLCQALIPKMSGQGRALALEIMCPNPAIRNLIREDKIHQIYSTMQTGQDRYGMMTFNQSLFNLYTRRQISLTEAMSRSLKPDELEQMIARGPAATQGQRPRR